MFETLLVATDGSQAAEKAVDYAVEFAQAPRLPARHLHGDVGEAW